MSGTVWPQVVLSNAAGVPYDAGTPLPVTGSISATSAATATAAAPSYTEGASSPLSQNLSGDARVIAKQSGAWNITTVTTLTGITNALPAGTNLLGKTGIDQTTPGTTNGVVENATAASGGILSTGRLLSATASTNASLIKASAGRLYSIQGYSAASTVRYLKIYNKASAPTVGTDTPVKTIALPPGAGFAFDWPIGYSFSTGIALALTTGFADADTGALTAGDVLGLNLDFA